MGMPFLLFNISLVMAAKKGNKHGQQFQKGNKVAEKWTEEEALNVGNALIKWLLAEDENIFYEEFLYLNDEYYVELISYLSKKFKSFFKLIEKSKKIQEINLKKLGIKNEINPYMARFVLNVDHGLVEKREQKTDITTNGKEINTNIEIFIEPDED